MSYENHVLKFAKRFLGKKKFANAYQAFLYTREALDAVLKPHEKINDAFKEAGVEFWSTCGECDSPVLLDMRNCPFCGETLIESHDPVREEVETKTAKKAKKEPVEEPAEEPETEVEPVEDDEVGEMEVPSEEAVNKMNKKELQAVIKDFDLEIEGLKEMKKIAELRAAVNEALEGDDEEGEEDLNLETSADVEEPEFTEEEEVEVPTEEKEEDLDPPSADEVDGMSKKDLLALIEEFDLEIDEKLLKGRVAIKKIRDAVNEALDEMYPEDDEEGDDGESDEAPKEDTSDESKEFMEELDSFNLDDDAEDLENMELGLDD